MRKGREGGEEEKTKRRMNGGEDSLPLREPLLQQQQQQQLSQDHQQQEGHGVINNGMNNMTFSTPATFYSCRTSAVNNGTANDELLHHEDDYRNDNRNDADSIPHAHHDHNHHHHHHHHHHAAVPWYRNSLQIMAMLSNYSTSYNVVNISLVLPILEQLFLMQEQQQQDDQDIIDLEDETSTTNASAVASSLLAGMVLGQVLGGCLGDASCLGLKRALILVMVLQIVASLGSALVVPSPASTSKLKTNSADDLYWSLAAWRFVLGIGAGAVYPLAACLSVEQGQQQGHSNGHGHHHPRAAGNGSTNSSALPAETRVQQQEEVLGQGQQPPSSPPRHLQCPHPPPSSPMRDEGVDDDETLSPPDDDLLLQQQQEQQNKEQIIIQQSRRVVWTFCTQGLGFWTVPVIASVLLYTVPLSHLDVVWRILLGLGSVPGFVLIYLQCRLYRHQNHHHHAVSHHSNDSENNGGPHQSTVSTVRTLRQRLHLDHRHDDDDDINNIDDDDDINNTDDDDGLQQPLLQGRDGRQEEAMINGCCPTTAGPSSDDQQNHSSNNNNNNIENNHHHHSRDVLHGSHTDSDDEETVRDCELRTDSDGEVGTLLDSNPDLSSVGIFRASEHAAIRLGWWASLTSEPDLVRKLLGTAGTWFLFDVLFYGNTLFQPIVTEAAFGPRQQQDPLPMLQRTAIDSLLLTSIALPGYFVAALVMGRTCCGSKLLVQTPRFVMLQGFAVMAVLYTTIGLQWHALQQHNPLILLFLYSSTFFFCNYGPNTTTFILPSLVFSPECRSTLNGLAAASGKAGALAGATFFAPAAETWGDAAVMLFCGAIAVVAFIMTQLFVQLPNNNNHDNATTTSRMMAATTAFGNDGVLQQHQRVVSLSDSFNPRHEEEEEEIVFGPNTSNRE